jgi:hypothetical protein
MRASGSCHIVAQCNDAGALSNEDRGFRPHKRVCGLRHSGFRGTEQLKVCLIRKTFDNMKV